MLGRAHFIISPESICTVVEPSPEKHPILLASFPIHHGEARTLPLAADGQALQNP
jgi:hypothetical protein